MAEQNQFPDFSLEIFPEQELSDTEQVLLLEVFSSPVVKRYLRILGFNIARDLLTLDSLQIAQGGGELYLRSHAYVKGQLAILNTLMSVQQFSAADEAGE